MSPLSKIAEKKINQAIADGKLDCSRFKDKPLVFEDDSFVPKDLRMAYKILKNGGYVPPEVQTRKEIHNLEQLIADTEDEHLRVKQIRKLNVLMMKLDSERSTPAKISDQKGYYAKIVEKTTLLKKDSDKK